MKWTNREYVDLMTYNHPRRPMFSELFGPIVGLPDEWRAQGATEDMIALRRFAFDYVPYYNLGNLYCLSSEHINSIENYTRAIELYPKMGDAYFNRGLVLIYLKDKEKGCIDLSRAGELGVQDAYGVIKKYCEEENE